MTTRNSEKYIRAEAMLTFTELPAVFYLYCAETIGEHKHKYMVFLSADGEQAYYFMINSKSYFADGCEISVTPAELPCLLRSSFIDCREVFVLSRDELIQRITENIDSFNRGTVPGAVKSRMADAVRKARTLTGIQKRMILRVLEPEEHS